MKRETRSVSLFTQKNSSMGGMQVLEWLVTYPELVSAAIPVGAPLAHTAQGIAYNLVGREAIMLDPGWQGGGYYGDAGDRRSSERGLTLARMVGIITYQSDESIRRKFARKHTEDDPSSYYQPDSRFQVESYLHYQGEALVKRFDANSYLRLSRAMDLHDIGRGRGGTNAALARIDPAARTLVIGIDSDILFPTHLQREMVERITALGRRACYHEIASPWGHDAFLIEYDQLGAAITRFLEEPGDR